MICGAERLQGFDGIHRDPGNLLTAQSVVAVENTDQLAAPLFKINVLRNGFSKVAYADENGLVACVHAKNLSDLGVKLRHIITVALLSEAAEAVQILTNLGSGQPHTLCKLPGGDPDHSLTFQFTEKAIVTGHPTNHRMRDTIFCHAIAFPGFSPSTLPDGS